MKRETVQINGDEYEVVPVKLSSTAPDDSDNIQYLLETLERRIKKHDLINIEREHTDFGEVSNYTVLLLKKA